jgi:hypothetical protein
MNLAASCGWLRASRLGRFDWVSMPSRAACALLLGAALLLSGCGKGSVERKRAIRACMNRPAEDHGRCIRPFNAEHLLGLTLAGARKLAARYGYEVERVAPLERDEFLIADYESDRLDVECSGISEDSIVVALKEQG